VRITVDLDKCIAAGSCVAAASAVFDQRDDDGMVVLLQQDPAESDWENARLAAGVCPSAAITIDE
jgi:ferredoxin